jgi:hypothetical protein
MKSRTILASVVVAGLLLAAQSDAGRFRWTVKTGTDRGAITVKAKKATTVAALARLQRPEHVQAKSGRIPPIEETIYTVHAKLLLYRLESDGDYHVVLQDLTTDSTLISEIPDPTQVADDSPWKAQIEQARSAFESQFHPTSSRRDGGRVPITVEGVGFFDKRHDATGAAGNGIELHPVLWIHIGS